MSSRATRRGDRIRTCDLPLPKRALYQAELRPESPTQLVDSPARARRSMRQHGWTHESLLHGQGARCERRAGCGARARRQRCPRTGAVDGLPTTPSRVAECAHDRPSPSPSAGPALRRWPADPAQLVDTTRCPACFSTLASTRCDVCGLDLGVPAAAELLAMSTAIYEGELATAASSSTRMRAAQAAREACGRLATSVPVECAAAAVTATGGRRCRPVAIRRRPIRPSVTDAVPTRAASSMPGRRAGRRRPRGAAAAAAAPAVPGVARRRRRRRATQRRSGVQVLLLTLGVVLISVTAIVFLFVAYLVASLEVRSVIIAARERARARPRVAAARTAAAGNRRGRGLRRRRAAAARRVDRACERPVRQRRGSDAAAYAGVALAIVARPARRHAGGRAASACPATRPPALAPVCGLPAGVLGRPRDRRPASGWAASRPPWWQRRRGRPARLARARRSCSPPASWAAPPPRSSRPGRSPTSPGARRGRSSPPVERGCWRWS